MRFSQGLLAMMLAATAVTTAHAQTELMGEWSARHHEDAPERGEGPEIGEFEGLPINASAFRHAETWSPSLWTVPEHQCIPHPADYGPAFSNVRIWKDVNPITQEVVAYHTNISWNNPVRTIWMDGRAHPPKDALHTWEGFSTGHWEGDVLVVETTHLKTGYVSRAGVLRSTKGKLTEYFYRVGDYLTWVSIVEDPVNLTEALIRSRNYFLDPGYQVALYPCSTDIEVPRKEGEIPHFVDRNPDLHEYADKHRIPHVGTDGGAATAYPEFQKVLAAAPPTAAAKGKK